MKEEVKLEWPNGTNASHLDPSLWELVLGTGGTLYILNQNEFEPIKDRQKIADIIMKIKIEQGVIRGKGVYR